ncbi:MJ0042-type zinc finger domain-containing protein [Zavarzinella formosa]|uniref:MJ0042-type zinc finger domain-containing protein n=1 Tax=Zavarzinella formosa TaxID=360055 RepID=UPI00030F160F|nr:MJ0042-type zinc finger domain-containing protein [Zavarzinella formosa]
MSIVFACPTCKTQYTVNDQDAGKKSNCKKCGQRLQVPAPPPPQSREMIQFNCPVCKTAHTVDEEAAGQKTNCKSCGQRLQVPGMPPRSKTIMADLGPAPGPDYSSRMPTGDSWPVPEPEPHSSESAHAPNRPISGAIGTTNRVLAGIGCVFLLMGLFLPMIQGPFGIWLSFVDVPWKAVTLGFAVADEIQSHRDKPDSRRGEPDIVSRNSPWKSNPGDSKSPEKPVLVIFVVVVSLVYPFFLIAIIVATVFQASQGRKAKTFLYLGIASLAATIGYALSFLSLNALPELRLLMATISPGFGWAVIMIGAVLVLIAGKGRTGRI